MTVTIRRGVAGDAELLSELAARTFRGAFAADNRPEDVDQYVGQAFGESQQRAELVDPAVTTLLAYVDGQLAGYAQLRTGPAPECVTGQAPVELWRFYVDGPWHGMGVAQSLLSRVDKAAIELGARVLWLGVWERNERGKAFYRKTGFQDVGSQTFVLGNDEQTDRIMTRPCR